MWLDLITVAETPTFMRQAENIWSDEEREAFVDFIARNPEAGDVIPDTGAGSQGQMGQAGQGERRRHAGHLLFLPGGADLSIDGLCEGGAREHFARNEEDSAGVCRENQAGASP